MNQTWMDEFEKLDLPFRTNISAFVDHDEESHDEIELVWVIEGKTSIHCEKGRFELTSDTVFMIYMNQKHTIKSELGSLSISFRLKKDYLAQHHLYFDKIPFNNRVYTFKELALKYHAVPLIISQLILLLKTPDPSPNIRYKIIGYYNMYVYDLYSVRMKERYLDVKKKNYDEYLIRFHRIIEYINTHYKHQISLTTLANLVGISPFRLSHFIRDTLGISFQEYVQNIRFEHALKDLKDSKLSIHEIVKKCGFSDPKYLNSLMKKRFHLTALKYRIIMKDSENFGIKDFSYDKLLYEFNFRLNQIDKGIYMNDTFGLKDNL